MDCEYWGTCPPEAFKPIESYNCGVAGTCSSDQQEAMRDEIVEAGGDFFTPAEALELGESMRSQGELLATIAGGDQ